MNNDPNPLTIWQCRAKRTGFMVWDGKEVSEMTDEEIEVAFDGLSKDIGLSYIWGDPA